MKVEILRLGHRRGRDARVTTHVGLTGRAFGASGIVLAGERDQGVLNSLRKVAREWGGSFETSYRADWQNYLLTHAGKKVHLTMYGLPVDEVIAEIRESSENTGLLIVVGSEKVPGKVYELVDYNVSVTGQPHSEISSLAIFLDRLFCGRELSAAFPGARREIVPLAKGKKVLVGNGKATSSAQQTGTPED